MKFFYTDDLNVALTTAKAFLTNLNPTCQSVSFAVYDSWNLKESKQKALNMGIKLESEKKNIKGAEREFYKCTLIDKKERITQNEKH